jgi:putative salt-induced outer membrane protein
MNKFFILFFTCGLNAVAADPSAWSHESEASVVQVGGNTTSESYSAKQKTGYKLDTHIFTGAARYLQSKANQVETAKQWDASVRYEKELAENWGLFLQHGAESDSYAGYVQRDNSDIGGKFTFLKQSDQSFFGEFGYRYIQTQFTTADKTYSNSGRVYLEYSAQINDSVTGKLWAEYLPNFTVSDAYLLNYEPSVNVMMSKVLSLKVAYLVKYHNKTKTNDEKNEDTSFTTALVAKF